MFSLKCFVAVFLSTAFVAFTSVAEGQATRAEQRVTGFTPAAGDWPWWRGPAGNGVAPAGQNPPLTWSETENVLWKTPIPGRGHSSATVVGDRVYFTTAEEDRELLSVVCLDRKTGA